MHGREWLVEAHGCDPVRLADPGALARVFERMIAELELHPVAPARWHRFPGAGGVTGMCMLAESHLACHTFPEFGSLCLNLFCCRARPEWDYRTHLADLLGATDVRVRTIERPYGAVMIPAIEGVADSTAATAQVPGLETMAAPEPAVVEIPAIEREASLEPAIGIAPGTTRSRPAPTAAPGSSRVGEPAAGAEAAA
ncbi:MAG TPA: S-adenosylmethionine decarboxylase [Longimicrobium sp.]|nr:S-adenosylmethionine decarboxylase [Longimicrobium sp.]